MEISQEAISNARKKALSNARLLNSYKNAVGERDKIKTKKIFYEIKEDVAEAKLNRLIDEIETGEKPKVENELTIPLNTLLELFENRCDAFCKYYFSPRFEENYDGIIKNVNSKLHWWLYDRLHSVVELKGGTKTAVAAPRGNAKSMVTSVMFVIWCLCFEKKRHIVIISDTDSQAQKFLDTIKNELVSNALLVNDFPKVCGRSKDWRVGDIITNNGIKVDTFGMGGAIRGTTFQSIRPDLVIMDDIENDEHVNTADQRKKAKNFLEKKILKLGNRDTDYFLIGTILHYNSLLSKTLVNPSWYSKKFKSVISWSESPLWEEWETRFTNLSIENRIENSRRFYKEHEDEMLTGAHVLWPEEESYLDLMEMREGEGHASFNSEKQNEPIDPDEAYFMEDDIAYFDERELRGRNYTIVGAVDPSLGKSEKSNFSAIITLAKDSDGYLYVLDADIKRRTPDQIIDDILLLHKHRNYRMFGVESVLFQEFFKDELLKRSRKAGSYLPAKGIKPRKDKQMRIQSLQPLVKTGTLKFKKSQITLTSQLLHFPLDDDDGPDALSMAVSLVRKQFRLLVY